MSNYHASRSIALEVLASGEQSFAEWVAASTSKGADRGVLADWPKWKAQGLLTASVRRVDGKLTAYVAPTGEGN